MALIAGFYTGHDPVMLSMDKRHCNIEVGIPAHRIKGAQDIQGNGHMFIPKGSQRQQDPALIADRNFFRGHF